MDFDTYQKEARLTDQYPDANRTESIQVPLLGLIGEVGSIFSTFKKRVRDKAAFKQFIPQLREEMGDVLWYLANLASKFDLSLDEIAQANLAKAQDRWPLSAGVGPDKQFYDDEFPESEQLPRKFCVEFREHDALGHVEVQILVDGEEVGDPLTDNAYHDDGYRYHDVFHIAYAAFLAWSPVLRKILNRKRKTCNRIDEVEDGARARILEEAISLYVYAYAREHNDLADVNELDLDILTTIRGLVAGLEVQNRTSYEWKKAILLGYDLFRELRANRGGRVAVDLYSRSARVIGNG